MEATEWDCNPDAYRFAEGALRAILETHPGLEEVHARGTTSIEGIVIIHFHSCQSTLLKDEDILPSLKMKLTQHHIS